jgi:hypothetical protein
VEDIVELPAHERFREAVAFDLVDRDEPLVGASIGGAGLDVGPVGVFGVLGVAARFEDHGDLGAGERLLLGLAFEQHVEPGEDIAVGGDQRQR